MKKKYFFVQTPRDFIIAKLSIRKPGSSSVLVISGIYAECSCKAGREGCCKIHVAAQLYTILDLVIRNL